MDFSLFNNPLNSVFLLYVFAASIWNKLSTYSCRVTMTNNNWKNKTIGTVDNEPILMSPQRRSLFLCALSLWWIILLRNNDTLNHLQIIIQRSHLWNYIIFKFFIYCIAQAPARQSFCLHIFFSLKSAKQYVNSFLYLPIKSTPQQDSKTRCWGMNGKSSVFFCVKRPIPFIQIGFMKPLSVKVGRNLIL